MKNKNLQLLWVTNNWSLDFGGRKFASEKIIDYLSLSGFNVTILNFEIGYRNSKASSFAPKNKAHWFSIHLKNNQLIPLKFAAFTKNKNFNKIILSASAPINLLIIFYLRIFRLFSTTEVILFEHTNPLADINLARFSLLYSLLSRLLYQQFDHLVTPSKQLSTFFKNNFSIKQEKIQTIHYPIISKNLPQLQKKKLSHPLFKNKKNKIIITIARLDLGQKDYPTLFRSFKEVLEYQVNTYLAILGTGPDEEKIKSLAAELGIRKNVAFLGFKPNPYPYLIHSNLFVLSSKFEGFGIALVEAMACQIPVISTASNFGPREILENGKYGLLVPVGNHQALTEAIIKMMNNRTLREKFIKNGAKHANDYLESTSLQRWYNFLLKNNEK